MSALQVLLAGEPPEVGLHPHRRIRGPAVLPTAEPQEDELQVLQLLPDGLHVLEARGTRVVQFSAENEERLAVDDELGGGPLLPEVRNLCRRDGGEQKAGHKNAAHHAAILVESLPFPDPAGGVLLPNWPGSRTIRCWKGWHEGAGR